MSEPYIGEIIIFAGNFAPAGWVQCQGQLLSIAQYQALFSILGTMYGGNGVTNFGVPDLRSRVAVGIGQGPGLSVYTEGQLGGSENVTLNTTQMPLHNHTFTATGITATVQAGGGVGTVSSPAGNYLTNGGDATGQGLGEVAFSYAPAANAGTLANIAGVSVTVPAAAIGNAGGSQPHTNIQPYLGVNYIMAIQGIFPSRG
jgi:microcystin-dependent protein